MKGTVGILACLIMLAGSIVAGEKEISTEQLINWMRQANTRQIDYWQAHQRFATESELRTVDPRAAHDLDPAVLAPYTLSIIVSPDGKHYQAALIRSANTEDPSTHCETAVFSDDTGLIYTGKNIGCE